MTNLLRTFLPVATLGLTGLLPSIASAVTVSSAPFGVVSADAPVGMTGISLPLIADEVFTGRVSSNTDTTITFDAVSGGIGSRLTAGDSYYLEIVSGPLEGERFDVDTAATVASANATVTVNLAATSFSTSHTLGANVLAQARAVLRPHQTLGKLAATFSPALVGNNNAALADGVRLMTPNGLVFYYLRGDGQSWREPGKSADLRSMVIPPDVSLIVQLRSGAKKWTHTGLVRRNAFRKNLIAGLQGFATGFPIDLSPMQVGAFTDTAQPTGARWSGSSDASLADSFKVFNAGLGDFDSYSLGGDGSTWTLSGGAINYASTAILKAPSMVVLSRTNPDPAYVIITPFTP